MGLLNIRHFLNLRQHSESKSSIIPSNLGLDPRFSYFILHASFGDKWYILSYFPELFRLQKCVKIIASIEDEQLIRIFVGEDQLRQSIILWESSKIEEVSSRISPVSEASNQLWLDLGKLVQTDSVIKKGIPVNTLRHLHIVKYPYYSDLHLLHGVPYDTLLKMLLYLPPSSMPVQPTHYQAKDIELADSILYPFRGFGPSKIVIFNVVNISHLSFSEEQIKCIINQFETNEFKVLLNISGGITTQNIMTIINQSRWAGIIRIPGHIMGLLYERVDAVFGVMGGAMAVSVYFSHAHTLSLYSNAVGFCLSSNNLYGGKYADNVWKVEEQTRPFNFSGRFVGNIEIGNPKHLEMNDLEKIISDFANKI